MTCGEPDDAVNSSVLLVGSGDHGEADMTGRLANVTQEELIYQAVESICYGVILPIILFLGVIGNLLNIIVFTRGRFRHTLDEIERSAATGLVALAVSDLIFCSVALPGPFLLLLPKRHFSTTWVEVVSLYYNLYSDPVLNVFLCSSTWLVVVVSLERYLAVCHPIGARWRIKVWKTALADVLVFVVSVGFNFPQFKKYRVLSQLCQPGCQCYYSVITPLYLNADFRRAYNVLCFLLAGILPFAFLAFCNIRLLLEIYRSRRMADVSQRGPASDRYCTSRITVILIAIIFLYFVLVVPSVFLEFFTTFAASTPGKRQYFIYKTTIVLTNVGQAVYFAMNFVLYCSLSRPFRENLSSQILCKQPSVNHNGAERNRYRMVKR